MKQHERHLTDRDRNILEFIVHYRVGTNDLSMKQCFEPAATAENVNRVLQRLERRGLIRRITSRNRYSYCTATRRTLELLEEEPRTPRPLTEQTLPIALAVATYCEAMRDASHDDQGIRGAVSGAVATGNASLQLLAR